MSHQSTHCTFQIVLHGNLTDMVHRTYNMPSADEVAAIIPEDMNEIGPEPSIIVHSRHTGRGEILIFNKYGENSKKN